MRVTVEDGADTVAIDRLLQASGSKEGDDLRRLALDSGLDRRVVQDGDSLRRSQPGQRGLELERFFDGLMHESLDDVLSPGAQRSSPEAATESFHAPESDAVDLDRIAIQHGHTGIGQDLGDLVLFARFEVMVSKNADGRYAQGSGDVLGQQARFLG